MVERLEVLADALLRGRRLPLKKSVIPRGGRARSWTAPAKPGAMGVATIHARGGLTLWRRPAFLRHGGTWTGARRAGAPRRQS